MAQEENHGAVGHHYSGACFCRDLGDLQVPVRLSSDSARVRDSYDPSSSHHSRPLHFVHVLHLRPNCCLHRG